MYPSVFALAMLLLLVASHAEAAGPVVERLFPAGGAVGTQVEVTATGKFDQWPVTAVLVVPRSNLPGVVSEAAVPTGLPTDMTVTAGGEKGKLTVQVAADARPGLHWLRLYDATGAADPVRFWVGQLPELLEQEPNNAASAAQVIAADSAMPLATVINGRLDKRGDADTFRVTLAAGQTLVAAANANSGLGSPVDPVLQVLTARGIVLAQNDDECGIDPLLTFNAPAAGDYLVRMFGFPAAADSSIQLSGSEAYIYRLTLSTGPMVDGLLPLTGTAATASSHEAFGWNLPADIAGRTLTLPHTAGGITLPSLLESTPLANENVAGTVELEPNHETPQAITLPAAVTGRLLEPRDRDVFAFTTTTAGQRVTFAVESRSLGYSADPVLEITDAAGKSLVRLDDTNGGDRDPRLTQAFDQPGEYRVIVSDLNGHASSRHVYLLRAYPAVAGFGLAHAKHAVEVAAGKTVELPISITREHGFAEEIAFTATGLPEGTSLAAATSAATGDTSKEVKLVLTAGTTPFSGPIRLLGTAPSQQHATTVNLSSGRAVTEEIWLTITPAP